MIEKAQAAIEAILFTLGRPVSLAELALAIAQDEETTRKLLLSMTDRYAGEDRGVQLEEADGSYRLCTKKEMYEYLIRLHAVPKKQELSQVQTEVLSIVAFRQPVTRLEIERIRGVKSDNAVNRLLELNLIEEAGRKAAPGRPILFTTTKAFLHRYGLHSAKELPRPDREAMEVFREEAQEEVALSVEV